MARDVPKEFLELSLAVRVVAKFHGIHLGCQLRSLTGALIAQLRFGDPVANTLREENSRLSLLALIANYHFL